MPENQIVFVLGMGRSGTSLLARILSLCGAELPPRLMGPDEGNPSGYWEPLAALEINEAFLTRFGSSWYDPTFRLQDEITIPPVERETYIGQIQEFLASCPIAPLLVIKEPRIAALSEFWFEAARRAGFTLRFVIPLRSPDEVSTSLATRDGISPELSSLLWLKYNLLSERCSRSFPRVFVSYPKIIEDWRQEMARVASILPLALRKPDEAAIHEFVSTDLYRQRGTARAANFCGQASIHEVYAVLSAAARDEPLDTQILDAIFGAHRASEYGFRHALDEFRERVRV